MRALIKILRDCASDSYSSSFAPGSTICWKQRKVLDDTTAAERNIARVRDTAAASGRRNFANMSCRRIFRFLDS